MFLHSLQGFALTFSDFTEHIEDLLLCFLVHGYFSLLMTKLNWAQAAVRTDRPRQRLIRPDSNHSHDHVVTC